MAGKTDDSCALCVFIESCLFLYQAENYSSLFLVAHRGNGSSNIHLQTNTQRDWQGVRQQTNALALVHLTRTSTNDAQVIDTQPPACLPVFVCMNCKWRVKMRAKSADIPTDMREKSEKIIPKCEMSERNVVKRKNNTQTHISQTSTSSSSNGTTKQ